MNNSKTELEYEKNKNYIQEEIRKKIDYSQPYYAQPTSVETDMNVFPYTRFFRGDSKSLEPIIIDREAGWRMQDHPQKTVQEKGKYPMHFFEPPCSTLYPVYSLDYTGGMRNNCVNIPP